jgi:MerR family transcriptional regulator, copper efflux regulator
MYKNILTLHLNPKIMLINELSKRTGITAHTIRFYEKSGLIKGKRDENVKSNNYFHYDEETVERLNAIVEAKAAGFSIIEISQFIDACFIDTYTKEEKLAILDKKLASLDEKINDLKQMKETVKRFRKEVQNDEY